ncbi:MAG TPA: hypothetical protein VHZ98_15635 [Galbitalea sp.]|jgi:hypothetical protein|nr:hypothetical protein [Galbitalea sp.]
MSFSSATGHFTRTGRTEESAGESEDPTFATSVLGFGGIQIPRGGRK